MSCQHCEQLEARSIEPVARCRAAVVRDSSSEEGLEVPGKQLEQLDPEGLRQAQLEDPEIGPVLVLQGESENRPNWQAVSSSSQPSKAYWVQWQSLVLINGVLYRDWEMPLGDRVVKQLLLPRKFRTQVPAAVTQLSQWRSPGGKQDTGEST